VNYFNVTGAAADGVEAELRADLGRGWITSFSYTYLDTRVTDPGFETGPDAAFAPGQRLIRRPTHRAAAQLHVPVSNRGRGTVAVRYTGDRDDLDFTTFPAARVTLRAAARVDVGGEYDVPVGSGSALAATIRVENLLADDARDAVNFAARGRVLLLGARVRVGR
jgi:outer membrane cobalamin receptor